MGRSGKGCAKQHYTLNSAPALFSSLFLLLNLFTESSTEAHRHKQTQHVNTRQHYFCFLLVLTVLCCQTVTVFCLMPCSVRMTLILSTDQPVLLSVRKHVNTEPETVKFNPSGRSFFLPRGI